MSTTTPQPQPDPVALAGTSRRAVLAGAGGACAAALVGGCGTYGGSPKKAPPPAAGSGGGGAAGGGALAKVSDIPVGGGKIFTAAKVVITQPQQGTIKAFSSTCTHQGCTVNAISGGTINCPCHGSMYRIADGSVAGGPAPKPLPAVPVTVTDGEIRLA